MLLTVVFQSREAAATSPTGSEYDHALASNGAAATASGSTGSNTPGKAIDNTTSTVWQSSTTTGWLAVQFRTKAYVNVVHAHFTTTTYPRLSLYMDTSGNGVYEAGEKAWSTTTNTVLDVIISLPSTSYALGMEVTIDATVGTNKPQVNEFEAYLQGDSDGDGLTNAQETGTVYYQDAGPFGLPSAIPDDRANASTSSVSLAPFYGIAVRGLANLSVVHPRRTDLTAAVGYWNGSAWIDRYVWDPGKHLLSVGITQPDVTRPTEGNVPVVATVVAPDVTSKVEFRVDGSLQQTVTSPIGNEYRWTWPTSGDGPHILNVTQYDTLGAKAWDQDTVNVNNLGPAVTWLTPANGATVSGTVSVWVSAPDYFGTQKVDFYLDNVLQFIDAVPEPGSSEYIWSWDSSGAPLGSHSLKVVAFDNNALLRKSTTSTISVTTVNDPTVSITYPAANAQVSETVTVQATATSVVSSIQSVSFYVGPTLTATDTTSPYAWVWDTTVYPNGPNTLTAIAVRTSDGKTASASIQVFVENTGCEPSCPTFPEPIAESPPGGSASIVMGVLSSEWAPGETDAGTTYTVVVDLVNPQSTASPGENASRIFRPALPLSTFTTYLAWRLIVRDWVQPFACVPAGDPNCQWVPVPGPSEGNVTAFVLRFEAKSDPQVMDTDGEGIGDGTEVNAWSTLPVTRDSDLDGLAEGYEITPHPLTVWTGGASSILAAFTTNPTLADTDGDGLTDGQERGLVTTGQSKVVGEVGLAVGVTDLWMKVFLKNKYTNPVVVAQPPTLKDTASGIVRIQSVTDHSFELRFQGWSAVGGHGLENVSYLVVESGNHVLPDGTSVEAGTKAGVGTTYVTTTFREAFAQSPIVLAQMQTYADSKAGTAKIRSVSGLSFDTYVRTNPIGTHGAETVGYVAVAPQADTTVLSTWTHLAASLGSAATGTISFPKNFTTAPRVLAGLATENTNPDVSLRLSAGTNASFSYVRETSGTAGPETLHYFAFAQPMNLTARMTTKPTVADTDGDTLADGVEVNTHGSNPAVKDSDGDGLADNVEVADRTITIPVNGTSKTITFKTSPTSEDTDADGVKDPDEVAGILDHRILHFDMETLASGSKFRDLSGSGADGAAKFVQVTSATPKKVGNATLFNGTAGASANRVLVPSSPWLNLTGGFTILAWVYPTTTTQTSGAGIVAKGYGNSASYVLDVVTSGSSKVFRTYVGSSTYEAKSTAAISANTWYQVAAVYDPAAGTVQLYVNLNSPVLRTAVPAISTNTHDVSIGSRESTSTSGYDLSFKGRLDEVQIWDRPLTLSQIRGVYNATTSTHQARLDFETRTATGALFDFSGTYHRGVVTGTTVVEGRTGFARRLAGGTDGIVLSSSSGITIGSATGATVDVLLLISSMPTKDTSLVARLGSFYLNLSSDGSVRWSLHKVGTVATPLPIPLNRWVRLTATASASTTPALSVYLDGGLVASGSATAFPSTANGITLGYTSGQVHLSGAVDEFLLYTSVLSATTISGLGPAGIRLNPNATDTDFDGLADGQELFVKSVKTPKRTPTKDQLWISSDKLDLALGAPAWAIKGIDAMIGFTHEDMGQLEAWLERWTGTADDLGVRLRLNGNTGQSNNFTSYDLLQKPSSGAQLAREDVVQAGRSWYVKAYDATVNKKGQIEYLQFQVTVRTLPNRADTDVDSLSDSEELNLGSDGFATDPWKADTDEDTLADNEYATKGTSPVLADTDRDGVRDNVDRVPLGDAFVEVRIESTSVSGSDSHNAGGVPLPFVKVAIQGNATYTPQLDGRSGTWYTTDYVTLNSYVGHRLSVNVPDDVTQVDFTVEMWSYDSRGYNEHTRIVPGSYTAYLGGVPYCEEEPVVTRAYTLQAAGQSTTYTLQACSGTPLGANPLTITLATIVPDRVTMDLIVPVDYSGVYNVTDASGGLVGRRYVGEPRFVGILLNATTYLGGGYNCYCGPPVPMSILVPRSVFFDTELYRRLNASNPTSPLDKLTFRQNDTSAASTSDGLQQVLTGNVTMGDWVTILDLLRYNETNVAVRIALRLTNDLFLYSLPDDAVRFVAYTPPLTAPSWTYTFCSGSCGPPTAKPWWELVWTGLLIVAAVLSAVVLPINAFLFLVQILVQVGNWLWTNLVGPGIQIVASAVRAAAEAVVQFATALQGFIEGIVRTIVDTLLGPIQGMLQDWANEVRSVIQRVMGIGDTDGEDSLMLEGAVFNPRVLLLVEILATGVELAIGAVTILSFLAPTGAAIGLVFKKVVLGALKAAFENMILSTIIAVEAGAIIGMIVPKDNPIWGWTSAIGTLVIALLVSFIQATIAKRIGITPEPLDADRKGLILALLGFFLSSALLITGASGVWAVIGAWTGAIISGLGLLIALKGKSWNDQLDEIIPGLGFVDELVAAGSFGFAVGVAVTTR